MGDAWAGDSNVVRVVAYTCRATSSGASTNIPGPYGTNLTGVLPGATTDDPVVTPGDGIITTVILAGYISHTPRT